MVRVNHGQMLKKRNKTQQSGLEKRNNAIMKPDNAHKKIKIEQL